MSKVPWLLVGGLVGDIVVHHHGRCCWQSTHLHHWQVSAGAWRVLSNIHHHSLARLINQHGHGHLLAVGAAGWWHSTKLRGRGWLLPNCASRWVIGNGQTLLRALLLLGVMIGWSAAASQGQDGLVHSGNRSANDVGQLAFGLCIGPGLPCVALV